MDARAPDEIEAAFASIAKARAQALVVFTEPMIYSQRSRMADLAARNRLPTVNMIKGHAEAGDLIAYGPDYRDLYRRTAEIVDKILKDTNPQALLLRADQVIE